MEASQQGPMIEKAMKEMDRDGDDVVSFDEFVDYSTKKKAQVKKEFKRIANEKDKSKSTEKKSKSKDEL